MLPPKHLQSIDSLSAAKIQVADSLDAANKKELKKIEQPAAIVVNTDTVPPPSGDLIKDIHYLIRPKATWLCRRIPGVEGTIYNHQILKLPINHMEDLPVVRMP